MGGMVIILHFDFEFWDKNMDVLPFQAEIAAQMLAEDDEPLLESTQFVYTPNGYWIAWTEQNLAAVWLENSNTPCDWVEGAENLEALYEMVSSGEWDSMLSEEASDEEWDCGETCSCGHGHV